MIESDYLTGNTNNNLMKDLKKIPTLKTFNEDELNRLLKMSKIRKYKPGEPICKEGYHDSWIYFLASGKVKIVKNKRELSTLNRRGEIFGEMSVIDGFPRSASVYALDTTVCLATDTFYIERLSGTEKVAFGYILYRLFSEILASRLRVTNKALIKEKCKKSWGFLGILFSKISPSYS